MTAADDEKWNVTTLKALIEQHESRNQERFTAMRTAVDAALAAADRAVSKAEAATERRFEGVNEFRAALSDQSRTLMPRTEYVVQHETLVARVNATDKRVETMQVQIAELLAHASGRSQGLGNVGAVVMGAVAAVASLVAIATLIFNIVHATVK